MFSSFGDSKGNLWFATVRGGVYKYDGKSFTLYTKKDGLGGNTSGVMAEDKSGNIWFPTEGGATRFDGKSFTNFTTKDGLPGNEIETIICDKAGKLWIGGKDGISVYDGKSFTVFKYKDGTLFKQVASLFEDKNGNIWIGSGTGFYVYNGKTFSEQIRPHFVMYLCQDKEGKVWTAMNHQRNDGSYEGFSLYRFDPEQMFGPDAKSYIKVRPKHEYGNHFIFGIMCDSEGKIWYGTGRGITRFDPLKAQHDCVQGKCKHEGSPIKMVRQHEDNLLDAFMYFTR